MVCLLDVDPDLEELLSVEERMIAGRLKLRTHKVRADGEGADIAAVLQEAEAFGAIVLDGMLVHRMTVADQAGLRLLGAGDIVMRASGASLMVVVASELTGMPESTVALLDDALLFAIRRWPAVAVRLLERFSEQTQTLAAQFVIAQLPRVDQRVLALMWLLAERWGRVTMLGTHLPLSLTHVTIGALIGARRSTVTLALRELVDRGALLKHEQGWLLVEPPAKATASTSDADVPALRSCAFAPQPPQESGPPDEARPARELTRFKDRQLVRAAAVEQRRRAAVLVDRASRLRGVAGATVRPAGT